MQSIISKNFDIKDCLRCLQPIVGHEAAVVGNSGILRRVHGEVSVSVSRRADEVHGEEGMVERALI